MDVLDAQHLNKLLKVSQTLSSTPTQEGLFENVLTAALELTRTEIGSILLADRYSGRLHLAASTNLQDDLDATLPIEGTAAGLILSTRQYLVIDAESSQRYGDFANWDHSGYRNMLGVPLLTTDRAIGVLEVFNKEAEGSFNQQDIAYLQSLASQAAISIENLRLFKQTDLISEFMHELKTPLMAITAASELLARDELSAKSSELVEMIQNETIRLAKMTQDFLDLARLEAGRVQIDQVPVNLNHLVQDVIRIQKPQATSHQIVLQTDLPEKEVFVTGDYDRLKQVLLNLSSNAIKYNCERGKVIIAVSETSDEAIIEVSDTGPGIAKENLSHLFERFYRIPDSEGFTKGTGLGLSISARIVQEHGGRIEVESKLGQGSVFRCRLPGK